jgi:5'-nucleotidase (lipoprotein e(P4) family)
MRFSFLPHLLFGALFSALLCFPTRVVTAQNSQSGNPQRYEGLNSVAWQQTAVEYRAITTQTYRAAEAAMLEALKAPYWTAALEQTGQFQQKPPAVVLDLDETVLDNSGSQVRLTLTGQAFSEQHWTAWIAEERAHLVPGAIDFLKSAQANGVALIYITNRVCDTKMANDHTIAVLKKLDVPLEPANLLCKEGKSDKSERRLRAAEKYRILLLIGDDFNDFLSARSTSEERQLQFQRHANYFGKRWFLMPNPMYGSWERAIGSDWESKKKALRE